MVDIKYRASCDTCLRSKVKCSQTKPACSRCSRHGHQCVYSQYRKIGRPSHKTLVEQTRRKKPSLHQQSPAVRTNDFAVQDCVLLDALPATISSEGTTASPDGFDAHTATSLPLDFSISNTHNMSYPEQLDWTDLGNLLDLSTTLSPPGDAMPLSLSHDVYRSPQTDLNDFTNNISRSPKTASNNSQSRQLQPFAHHRRPSTLLRDRRHSNFPGSAPSTNQTPSSEHHETLSTRPPASRRSSFSIFRPSKFPVHPFSFDTPCTLQCQASLANQLAYISECQAGNSDLAFDTLLNLADNIRTERDRILSCPSCLEKPRRGQTLMLLTVVMGNLLSLFEREMSGRNCRSKNTSNGNKISPLPYMPRPLTIGDITVDDTIKASLSLRLLRTYLEQQLEIVAQLDHLRLEAEDADVSFKVTGELVADVRQKVEYFLGVVVFAQGSGPVSITRVAALDLNSQN